MTDAHPANMRIGTAREIADLLKVSVDHLYEMVQRGEIPTIRSIGPRLRFDLDAVEAWMKDTTDTAGGGSGSGVAGGVDTGEDTPRTPGAANPLPDTEETS